MANLLEVREDILWIFLDEESRYFRIVTIVLPWHFGVPFQLLRSSALHSLRLPRNLKQLNIIKSMANYLLKRSLEYSRESTTRLHVAAKSSTLQVVGFNVQTVAVDSSQSFNSTYGSQSAQIPKSKTVRNVFKICATLLHMPRMSSRNSRIQWEQLLKWISRTRTANNI